MNHLPSQLSHPKYRPDIDGLRAIAVLSVVAFHAFPSWIKGGFIGVDVFFVISGYLISTIIFENIDKGTFSFWEFYARRIKRIYPALLLTITASMILGWFALLADEYKQLGKHIMGAAGFVSNFVLWGESGYFDEAAESKPLLHLWSLGIEEQFYFIWPLLCWAFWRLRGSRFSLIILFIGASFLSNIYLIKIDGVATFYSPITRFWELLFGSLLSYITISKNLTICSLQADAIKRDGCSILGLICLLFGFWFINKDASFPGYWALIPVTGTVLIIMAGPDALFNRLVLRNRLAVWFGLISFPLYLWHWPLLSFSRIIERDTPSATMRIGAVLLAVLFAWITYVFIEKKVRSSSGYKPVKIFLSISMLLFACGWTVFHYDGLEERRAVVSSDFTPQVQHQFAGPIWSYTKNASCLSAYPYPREAELAWWFCMKSSTRAPTIILLGNSFANQLYPGFAKNIELSHHTILSIGTCAIGADGSGELPRSPCYGDRAKDQADFIDSLIKNNPSLQYAVLDGFAPHPSPAYVNRVLARIQFLENQGLKVIVFTPHIRPNFHPKACFRSPLKNRVQDCLIDVSIRQHLQKEFSPLSAAIRQAHPAVLFFDQNDVFCERQDGKCAFIKDGMPLHRDDVHISEYASILLQDYFNKWAQSNVPAILKPTGTDSR